MIDNKSITQYQKVYIVILIILLLIQLFSGSQPTGLIIFPLLVVIQIVPVLVILQYTPMKKLLIQYFLSILLVIFLAAFSFRKLRDLFSRPDYTHAGMVGYAQYFGYPLYLDTILFFCILLYPVVFFFITTNRKKKEQTVKKK
jgi:hypothetical protein